MKKTTFDEVYPEVIKHFNDEGMPGISPEKFREVMLSCGQNNIIVPWTNGTLGLLGNKWSHSKEKASDLIIMTIRDIQEDIGQFILGIYQGESKSEYKIPYIKYANIEVDLILSDILIVITLNKTLRKHLYSEGEIIVRFDDHILVLKDRGFRGNLFTRIVFEEITKEEYENHKDFILVTLEEV